MFRRAWHSSVSVSVRSHPAVGRVGLRNAVWRVHDGARATTRKVISQRLTRLRERVRRLAEHCSAGGGDTKELASVQHGRCLHTGLKEDPGRAERACQRPAASRRAKAAAHGS
jgi:hypothetical protein